jgi:large subunit ribosomal protein L9
MKIILVKDLPGEGKAGEIKEVSRGYARNYLLPKGLALVSTSAVEKQVMLNLEKERHKEIVERDKRAELAKQIDGTEVHFQARIGAGERLFGSITATDIAKELGRVKDCVIDRKSIELDKPLRQTGSYEVIIRLSKDLRPKITVLIER